MHRVSLNRAASIVLIVASLAVGACSGDDEGSLGTYVLAPSAVVLEPAEVATVGVEEGRLVLPSALAETLGVGPGTVLVAGHGNVAFLRRVVSVRDEGASVVADTTDAALTDAFEELSVSFDESDILPAGQLPPGVSPLLLERATFGWQHDAEVPLAAGLNATVSTRFDAGLKRLKIVIRGATLREFEFTLEGAFEAAASLTCGLSTSLEASLSAQIFPRTRIAGPYAFMVGVVPIVVGADVEVTAGLDLEALAAVTLTYGGSLGGTMTAGVRYGSSGWRPVASLDLKGTASAPSRDRELTFLAEAYVASRLHLAFYGIAGPYLEVRPYAALDARPAAATGAPGVDWTITGGVRGTVGGAIEVLGYAGEVSADLFDFSRVLASSKAKPIEPGESDGPFPECYGIWEPYEEFAYSLNPSTNQWEEFETRPVTPGSTWGSYRYIAQARCPNCADGRTYDGIETIYEPSVPADFYCSSILGAPGLDMPAGALPDDPYLAFVPKGRRTTLMNNIDCMPEYRWEVGSDGRFKFFDCALGVEPGYRNLDPSMGQPVIQWFTRYRRLSQ